MFSTGSGLSLRSVVSWPLVVLLPLTGHFPAGSSQRCLPRKQPITPAHLDHSCLSPATHQLFPRLQFFRDLLYLLTGPAPWSPGQALLEPWKGGHRAERGCGIELPPASAPSTLQLSHGSKGFPPTCPLPLVPPRGPRG